MESKLCPVKGMRVTWIEPWESPGNSRFIEDHLIGKHGRVELIVDSVDEFQSPSHHHAVTLLKDGKVIASALNAEKPAWFDWGYLHPLEEQDEGVHSDLGAGIS